MNYLGNDLSQLINNIHRAILASPQIWQHGLLSAGQFATFASERGIRIQNEEVVLDLWRSGLLRADLVISDAALPSKDFSFIAKEEDFSHYMDVRCVPHNSTGYGGLLEKSKGHFIGAKPQFHPFRLFIMYHIERVFKSDISYSQYLRWPGGLRSISDSQVVQLDKWTRGLDCADRFEYWSRICDFSIALEPLAYEQIHGEIRIRSTANELSLKAAIEDLRLITSPLITQVPAYAIRGVRQDLGQTAQEIDPNTGLHVLLRLMSSHERRKLRGRLGLSMLFLEMAESIRRPAEAELNVQMPEEDEIGYGQWVEGARRVIYGSDRVSDAPKSVLRDYLASMGLDYGVKVRCYVEGDTEYGALSSAIGDAAGVELVNLRGQVIERKGKGLAFMMHLFATPNPIFLVLSLLIPIERPTCACCKRRP